MVCQVINALYNEWITALLWRAVRISNLYKVASEVIVNLKEYKLKICIQQYSLNLQFIYFCNILYQLWQFWPWNNAHGLNLVMRAGKELVEFTLWV